MTLRPIGLFNRPDGRAITLDVADGRAVVVTIYDDAGPRVISAELDADACEHMAAALTSGAAILRAGAADG